MNLKFQLKLKLIDILIKLVTGMTKANQVNNLRRHIKSLRHQVVTMKMMIIGIWMMKI